jgi:sarcosine oxidase
MLALAAGAELHGHEPVTAWEPAGEGVDVRTTRGRYRARRLIISAGAWVASLVPSLAGICVPERQVLLWCQPLRPERYASGSFPVFILEAPDGRFYGFPVHGIPGLKIGLYHHRGEAVDPTTWDRERLRLDGEDERLLREGVVRYLPDAAGPTLTLKACLFTNTPDEHFIIDRLPDAPQVVVASPCSGHGFKFASVIGEIVADLALDGGTDADLSMFRLDRFAGPGRAF